MTEETPDLTRLGARLAAVIDRLDKLEVQVRGLVTSQTVEVKAFVVKDDRAVMRARLEMGNRDGGSTSHATSGR
jgi:hypothetical protein